MLRHDGVIVIMSSSLIQRTSVEAKVGRSRSAIFADMASGILPTPVAKFGNVNLWSSAEIDEVVAARAAGCGDDLVREIIKTQLARRKTSKAEIVARLQLQAA